MCHAPATGVLSMFRTRRISNPLKKLFKTTRPIRRSTCLELDLLEPREVPATFNVTSLLDSGATGTLRWAIAQSNLTTGSANAIVITNSAIGQLNLTAPLPAISQQVEIDNTSGGVFTVSGGNRFQILIVGAPITLNKINLTGGVGT